MATVVRTFDKSAAQTARGTGRARVNYGAAMKAKTAGLESASRKYNSGLIEMSELIKEQKMFVEQALGATAGGLNALTEGLNVIVGLSDKQMGALKLMSGSLQTARAMLAIHRMWSTYINAKRSVELAGAVAETAIPSNWPKIPFALTAVAIFGATFGGGFLAGRRVSQQIDAGTVDLSTSEGRRQVITAIEGAT